jgi:hypothetical protein
MAIVIINPGITHPSTPLDTGVYPTYTSCFVNTLWELPNVCRNGAPRAIHKTKTAVPVKVITTNLSGNWRGVLLKKITPT